MARRFRFRLQTLLRVRQLREREAKRKVAAKRAEIARLDRLNEQTMEEIHRQQEWLLSAQAPAGREQTETLRRPDAALGVAPALRVLLDPLTLQRGRAWIAYLRKTIALRHLQRASLVEELTRLQNNFRAARTQARIIERLRERRWAQYVRDRDRREQTAADELAQQLHGFDQRSALSLQPSASPKLKADG